MQMLNCVPKIALCCECVPKIACDLVNKLKNNDIMRTWPEIQMGSS